MTYSIEDHNVSPGKEHIMIDTLKYSEEFKKAGFDAKQAKILTEKLAETTEQIVNSTLEKEQVTKRDIKLIEKDISEIKLQIHDIKQSLRWF